LCYCSKDSTNKEGEERRHPTGRQKGGNMSATAFTLASVAIGATLQPCSEANALLNADRKTLSKWHLKTVSISQKAKFISIMKIDCLCGLVVRVPDYRFRGPGLDSQRYQIF
jgi:hypothetical protein